MMNVEVNETLKQAYDPQADARDAMTLETWKAEERQAFLGLLKQEKCTRLLEVGAGTGIHGVFFKEAGLEVVSTDLSMGMVEACRAKGLEAHQMDFLSLDFPDASFDAVFALNCILHVPRKELPEVLDALARVLKSGGLFFWGQYGGRNYEGELEWDDYEPKRFFSYINNDKMKDEGSRLFELLNFHMIDFPRYEDFQSGTWRRL